MNLLPLRGLTSGTLPLAPDGESHSLASFRLRRSCVHACGGQPDDPEWVEV